MARLSFRCDEELLRLVDVARGDVPRELWLRKTVQREVDRVDSNSRAVERASSEAKEPTTEEQADSGSVSSSEGVRSAAPAEQPDMRAMGLLREDDPDPDFVARGRVPEFPPSYRQHVPGPNVEGVRSSSQAKRDVVPVPKRGEKK